MCFVEELVGACTFEQEKFTHSQKKEPTQFGFIGEAP
jgi:hypothetical protein